MNVKALYKIWRACAMADPQGSYDWDTFHARVIFVYEERIAIVSSPENPRIGWAYAYNPGYLSGRAATGILTLLARMGLHEVRSTVTNWRTRMYVERLGFKNIGTQSNPVFSICLLKYLPPQSVSHQPFSARHSRRASYTAPSSTA